MTRKGKRKLLIAGIVFVSVVVVGLGGALLFTEGERREAKNLPIGTVNFEQLHDGTYLGDYEGGMYKWRANKVQVTVSSKKVTNIKLIEQKEKRPPSFSDELFGRVIQSQSLQVDTISGATLTSKAYLKAIEHALDEAQGK
ncbi:FMN-binding domain-containing protein [Fontibacillus panacisegetis]|uniref:FMN-binding domain-containing protein n=1 Tax=Fontibacillus panacisegetis TaxID=670482 RepID=A0A1G7RL87_9BACL|nr:FMN-binding protein [Fontibacillus panacisegetis]SDG10989.1 FMN-binding domain-containing protein [Fontibacillus panacisegetis]